MDRDRSARRATLRTVAEAAGVSVPTVSKVVNGRSDVAPETRARIQQLLLEQEYSGRTAAGFEPPPMVSMVFDAMRTPNNLEMLRGAIEAAAEAGVEIVTGLVPEDAGAGDAWARRVAGARRVGLIVVTSGLTLEQHREFRRVGVPVMTIDPINIPDRDVPSVGATNFNGGLEATDHLIALGHRRIGFIQGPPLTLVSLARLHGYNAALFQAGIPVDPAVIRHGDFTFDAGFRGASELLSLHERPSALFASNDLQALGAIEAARTLALRVPEDLSVVGFDDMAAAEWSAPPLTTVRQPFVEMGRAAVQNLLRLVDGEDLTGPRIELATHLVVRKSTTRCRSRAGAA